MLYSLHWWVRPLMSADYHHSLIRAGRVARVYIREGARSTGDSGERGKRFRTDEGTSPRLVIWYGSDQENKAVEARVRPLPFPLLHAAGPLLWVSASGGGHIARRRERCAPIAVGCTVQRQKKRSSSSSERRRATRHRSMARGRRARRARLKTRRSRGFGGHAETTLLAAVRGLW